MILVRGKTILTTEDERRIAAAGEQNASVHTFSIDRVQSDGVDLSALNFHMDIKFSDGNKDTVILEKVVKEESIELSYTVTSVISSHLGSCLCSLRGTDDAGLVKWRSFPTAFYVEDTAGSNTGGFNLSELEQLELKFREDIKELNDAEAIRVQQEQGRVSKETERVQAEEGRVSAEDNRQAKLQEIIRQKEVLDGYKSQLEETERGIVERLQQISDDAKRVSEENAALAKSYAVGGTGKRIEEASDNTKFYLEMCRGVYQLAKNNTDMARNIVGNAQETLNMIKNVRFDNSELEGIKSFNDAMRNFEAGKSLAVLLANLKKALEYVITKESVINGFGSDPKKPVSVNKFTEVYKTLLSRSEIKAKRIKGNTNENGHIYTDIPQTKAVVSVMKMNGDMMVTLYAPNGHENWWARVYSSFNNVLVNTYVEFTVVYLENWDFSGIV